MMKLNVGRANLAISKCAQVIRKYACKFRIACVVTFTVLGPTSALAQSDLEISKQACESLLEENFEGYTVSKVTLCNANLFSPDVFIIHYYDNYGKQGARQCLIGDGLVRIPSALAPWQC